MNYTKYNPRCYSGTKWDGGDSGAGGGDDVDDDPDEARRDGGDDGDNFPLPEGICPANFFLPESSLFSISVSPRDGGRKIKRSAFSKF